MDLVARTIEPCSTRLVGRRCIVDRPRREPDAVAGRELTELPPLARRNHERTDEAAETRAVRPQDDGHVAGEIDGANCVAGVVDVRRVQPRVAAVSSRPAGPRSEETIPVRAELKCTSHVARSISSRPPAARNSGSACGPMSAPIVHSAVISGEPRSEVRWVALDLATRGEQVSGTQHAAAIATETAKNERGATPENVGTSKPPRMPSVARSPALVVPIATIASAGTSIGVHAGADRPSTVTGIGAPPTAIVAGATKRKRRPAAVSSSAAAVDRLPRTG